MARATMAMPCAICRRIEGSREPGLESGETRVWPAGTASGLSIGTSALIWNQDYNSIGQFNKAVKYLSHTGGLRMAPESRYGEFKELKETSRVGLVPCNFNDS